MSVIRVVTAVIRDADGRLLLVRKRDTQVFMQPGGKVEPGETDVAALVRELREEIGAAVDPTALRLLGVRRAPAANEPGQVVEATIYELSGSLRAAAAGEIEEIWWRADNDLSDRPIAPLTRQHVLGID